MNQQEVYEMYQNITMPELCYQIAQLESGSFETKIARFVLEQKQMEEKFKFEKEQIKYQHELNRKLMSKQIRYIKFSAILTAISTLTAAIAGVLLAYMLQTAKPTIKPLSDIRQNIQFKK